ncbi:rad4-domain-containing protein [Mucor ambiguus]|uniref:Rad4-domain-containing protein n=1 Tax=Mucor ambiguus TaxID=91626 RepID=A0A0C9N129_9FUNG|nr:rad4-domain-containing protein [Mucor ambiguus]
MTPTRRSSKRKEPLNETSSVKKRAPKKAKLEQQTKKEKGKQKQVDMMEEDPVEAGIAPSDHRDEEDDDEEDEIDWETIHLPPRFQHQEHEQEHKMDDVDTDAAPTVYKDVEIVMETPRVVLKESSWERAYQRNLREWMHHSHVVTLIAHYKLRNSWCCDTNMKSVCLSIIPDNCSRVLSKDSGEAALKTGIKWLLKWWHDFFVLTGPGLLTRPYLELENYYNGFRTLKEWIDAHQSDEHGDYVEDLEAFMQLLVSKSGTRDTAAELFAAILRACGCDVRLVASIQPVPYKIAPGTPSKAGVKEAETAAIEDEDEANEELTKPIFKYRAPTKTYVDPNVQLRETKAKPPTVWCEVYCNDTKRWMAIDPIRGSIDKPALMEPATLNRGNHISFVLAFDSQNKVTDVTRRYTANMDKAIRLRERPLTRREKQGGMKMWSESLLEAVCKKKKTEQDHLEFEEMEKQQTRQVMPSSIGGFKNHPVYALERHLLKYEVLHPREPILGSIRGEKIYPRANVKTVSTAETYRKLGKQIKEGEQPAKMVKANVFTLEKKRIKEQAKQEGHDLLVACYGDWQTEPFVPLPVIDGKLPKNAYGSIDLFTSDMLPLGAAHIPSIAKLAKKLGIDYADAVVDFEFVKMRAVPVMDGIIVAEQEKWVLLEAWEEHEQKEALKAIAKQEKDVYIRWRKLIKSVLIKARVDQAYGSHDKVVDKWAHYNNDKQGTTTTATGGGGGFLPESDQEDT